MRRRPHALLFSSRQLLVPTGYRGGQTITRRGDRVGIVSNWDNERSYLCLREQGGTTSTKESLGSAVGFVEQQGSPQKDLSGNSPQTITMPNSVRRRRARARYHTLQSRDRQFGICRRARGAGGRGGIGIVLNRSYLKESYILMLTCIKTCAKTNTYLQSITCALTCKSAKS